jgi:hypothetical protein
MEDLTRGAGPEKLVTSQQSPSPATDVMNARSPKKTRFAMLTVDQVRQSRLTTYHHLSSCLTNPPDKKNSSYTVTNERNADPQLEGHSTPPKFTDQTTRKNYMPKHRSPFGPLVIYHAATAV